MKQFVRGLAALAAVATLSAICLAPARADSLLNPDQWIIKGGINLPSEKAPREVGRNWFAGGLEYQLGNPNATKVVSGEVIYTGASDDVSSFGLQSVHTRYALLSTMVNYRFRRITAAMEGPGNILFYGAGLGLQTGWVKKEDPNPGGGGVDKNSTKLGGNIFAGYEIAANAEIEAKYQFVFGKIAEEKLSGLQLLVGIRF